MAEEQNHIEIFTGSMRDLEAMTGRQYEAMKVDGKLVGVWAAGYRKLSQGSDVDNVIRDAALNKGADAVVEVVYTPYSMVLSISLPELSFPGSNQAHNIMFYAKGYCVKEVPDKSPHSEAEADIDV